MTFEAFNKHMLNDFKTISYAINDGMHVNKVFPSWVAQCVQEITIKYTI